MWKAFDAAYTANDRYRPPPANRAYYDGNLHAGCMHLLMPNQKCQSSESKFDAIRKLSSMECRGPTSRIDLDLQYQESWGHEPGIHMQKVKVKSHSVQK